MFFSSSVVTEIKRTLRLSLPLVLTQFVYGLSGILATIFLARLGKEVLAANILATGIFTTVLLFFMGILNAVSVLVSQSHGAADERGIRIVFQQSILLAFVFAIPMMAILWNAPWLFRITGQDPVVIRLVIPCCHALAWVALPLNLFVVMEQFLIGLSQTRLVMLISLLEVPVEIFFFYVLIFGKFGAPMLGLAGVGYGMAVAILLGSLPIALYLMFSKRYRSYRLFARPWTVSRKYLWEMIRIGIPLGAMYCIEVALFATMAFMIGKFGTDALAAHQIAYQCFIVALVVIFGLSQGTTTRVGYEAGQNNKPALKLAAHVSMGVALCAMLIVAVSYIVFSRNIIGLFVKVLDPKYQMVVRYAMELMWLVGIVELTDCFRGTAVGALRGLKDTRFPMIISVLAFWVIAFPAGYLFAFTFHLGPRGIWLGLVTGLASAAIMVLLRFHYLLKNVDLVRLVTRSS